MKINRLGIAAAIICTCAFSCHNEPDYERTGMSNPPGGSGSAAGPVPSAPLAAPAASSPRASAAKK